MDPYETRRIDDQRPWHERLGEATETMRRSMLLAQIKERRADYRRRNLASLALTMSLIGCLLFVTAPVGIILGFACLRGGSAQPRPGERVAMWAIILGLVPVSVVAAVIVEHFVTGHH